VDASSILVQQAGPVGLIHVVGRGSFKNASQVKQFAERAASLGILRFIYDLRECTHMDSTFMGTMAGLAIESRNRGQGPMKVVLTSAALLELLQTLGLDYLMEIHQSAPELAGPATQIGIDAKEHSKNEVSQLMLDAHENLVEADFSNADRFQDVLSFLRDRAGTPSKV
jgi:anti-sigma B factor antagonist